MLHSVVPQRTFLPSTDSTKALYGGKHFFRLLKCSFKNWSLKGSLWKPLFLGYPQRSHKEPFSQRTSLSYSFIIWRTFKEAFVKPRLFRCYRFFMFASSMASRSTFIFKSVATHYSFYRSVRSTFSAEMFSRRSLWSVHWARLSDQGSMHCKHVSQVT